MPRTKVCGDMYAYSDIGKTLARYQRACDFTDKEAATAICGGSDSTWRRRKTNPEYLTVKELWNAINVFRIPYDEAMSLIAAGIKSKPPRRRQARDEPGLSDEAAHAILTELVKSYAGQRPEIFKSQKEEEE